MSIHPTLQIDVEGTGISCPLSEHVNLPGNLPGQVMREEAGPDILDCLRPCAVCVNRQYGRAVRSCFHTPH